MSDPRPCAHKHTDSLTLRKHDNSSLLHLGHPCHCERGAPLRHNKGGCAEGCTTHHHQSRLNRSCAGTNRAIILSLSHASPGSEPAAALTLRCRGSRARSTKARRDVRPAAARRAAGRIKHHAALPPMRRKRKPAPSARPTCIRPFALALPHTQTAANPTPHGDSPRTPRRRPLGTGRVGATTIELGTSPSHHQPRNTYGWCPRVSGSRAHVRGLSLLAQRRPLNRHRPAPAAAAPLLLPCTAALPALLSHWLRAGFR